MNDKPGNRRDTQNDHLARVKLNEITRRLARYRVRGFLGITNVIAREKADEGGPFRAQRRILLKYGGSQLHDLVFGAWTLAFLAKYVILSSSDYRPDVTESGYFDLIALHGNLEDPIIDEDDHLSAFRFLFRMAWEQFTFQEQSFFLLPRYYLLLKDMSERDADRKLDIPEAWKALAHMSIEDFHGAWLRFLESLHATYLFRLTGNRPNENAIAARARTGP